MIKKCDIATHQDTVGSWDSAPKPAVGGNGGINHLTCAQGDNGKDCSFPDHNFE